MTSAIYCPRTSFALLAAAGLAVFMAAPETVDAADGDRTTSDLMSGGLVIPYEGSLAMDGQPMTGQVTLRFELWDHATDSEPENLRYSETQEGILLYNGRYYVGLGTGTQRTGSIETALLDGDRLFLGMAIQDGTGEFISLQSRQALEAVPFAAWTSNAADMSVAQDVTVGGNLNALAGELQSATMSIAGPVSASSVRSTAGNVASAGNIAAQGQVSAGGNITVAGNISGGGPGNVSGASVVASGEMRAGSLFLDGSLSAATLIASFSARIGFFGVENSINNSVQITTAQRLHIGFFADATDPGFEISGGDLNVPDGEITTDGDLIAESNTHDGCGWNSSWTLRDTTSSDGGNNQQSCGSGRFAAGIDFTHRSHQDGIHQEYYRLYCCEL